MSAASLYCVLGESFIVICVQCGFIDQISVRKPILIGPPDGVDKIAYTFSFHAHSNDTAINRQVDSLVSCLSDGTVQTRELALGCKGNEPHSAGPTRGLMWGVMVGAIVTMPAAFFLP